MDDEIIKDDEAVFEEPEADKTEDESSEDESENDKKDSEEEGKGKSRRSDIVQKKKWREKAQKASSRVQELETELATLREAVKKPDDDKERAAQEYIRKQARETYTELQLEKAKEESKELAAFEEKVQGILDDNPDVAEDELLDIIEEYEVEPTTALRILQKQSKDPKEKKPKMPQARRASAQADDGKKPDDSQKSMWQILKEEKNKLLNK